jgi:hypothetical protein
VHSVRTHAVSRPHAPVRLDGVRHPARRRDATGHLAAVVSSDTTVTYSYGATGMRELTVTEGEGGTETTEHFWRGATLTAERFSDGTVHEYVYGPGGLPLELVVRAPGQPAECTASRFLDTSGPK